MSIERVFAATVLAVCTVLLVRLMIGERRRWRLDAALRRAWNRTARAARSARYWRSSRRDAAKVAEEAIRRARNGAKRSAGEEDGEWDGNVFKPKSFRKPPHDKMH